ncbi:hypothetical protein HDU86_006506 [Geranomyces michiganensis]|nr:hypothetical protein HDU86_006506 [Geranomyces michiganensis]
MATPDVLELIGKALAADSGDSLQLLQSIIHEDRLRKEADLAIQQETTRQKALDLQLFQEQQRSADQRQQQQQQQQLLPPYHLTPALSDPIAYPLDNGFTGFLSTNSRFEEPLLPTLDCNEPDDVRTFNMFDVFDQAEMNVSPFAPLEETSFTDMLNSMAKDFEDPHSPAAPPPLPNMQNGFPSADSASTTATTAIESLSARATKPAPNQIAPIEIICQPPSTIPPAKKITTTRKAKHDVSPHNLPAICEICKKVVGAGGFSLVHGGNDSADEIWAPQQAIEIHCKPCRAKYALCCSCGGGGKFRTGKWRPIQMFPGGRATCSLSHIRLQTMKTRVHVWRIRHEKWPYPENYFDTDEPAAPTWALLQGIRECSYSVLAAEGATAKIMETNPAMADWEKLCAQLEYFAGLKDKEIAGDGGKSRPSFTGPPYNGDPRKVRAYLGVRWCVTDPEADSPAIWDALTPQNAAKKQPRVMAYSFIDVHMETGVVLGTAGISLSAKEAGRCVDVDILERAIADHDKLVAIAASAPAGDTRLLPVRPRWLHCSAHFFTEKQAKTDKQPAAFKKLRDLPKDVTPWAAQVAQHILRPASSMAIEHLVADVDELIAELRGKEDKEGTEQQRGKKRPASEN